MILKIIFVLFILFKFSNCLNNGLALTPPMGWLSWGTFKCQVVCRESDFKRCISEVLFMEMADRLVEDGYRDAGYEYVNIDDCWMSRKRNESGFLHPNSYRFPHGIKFLSDYMHSRGLKLGIYQNFGDKTCAGYPGSRNKMKFDIRTFEDWGVDMLKLDACFSRYLNLDDGFIKYSTMLKESDRPILFSCSWPFYQLMYRKEPNYQRISTHCNMWRNFRDIEASPNLLRTIIDFYGDNQEVLSPYVGPGHWNDPDMLMIGNHFTLGQSRIQMAIWSTLPAPLLMATDLRTVKPEFKEILLNKRAISINQDYLGIPGKRIYKKGNLEIWKRKISPILHGELSLVLVLINWNKNVKMSLKFNFTELSLESKNVYALTEVFTGRALGLRFRNNTVKITIFPMDCIMLHCIIQQPNFEVGPVFVE